MCIPKDMTVDLINPRQPSHYRKVVECGHAERDIVHTQCQIEQDKKDYYSSSIFETSVLPPTLSSLHKLLLNSNL